MKKRNEENKILVKLVKENNRYYFYDIDGTGYYKNLGIYKTIKRVKETINGTATNNYGEITPTALSYRILFECINKEDIEKFELEEEEAKKKAKEDKKAAELKSIENKKNSISGAKESKFEVGEVYTPFHSTMKFKCIKRTECYATFEIYNNWHKEPIDTDRVKISKGLLREEVYFSYLIGDVNSDECDKVRKQKIEELKTVLNMIYTAELFKISSDGYNFYYKIARTEHSKAYYLFSRASSTYLIDEETYNEYVKKYGEHDVDDRNIYKEVSERINEKINELEERKN